MDVRVPSSPLEKLSVSGRGQGDGDDGGSGLLRLPNEMVQRVLTFLPAASLTDTSLACPRLGSLTASRHLWRNKDMQCPDLDRLMAMARASAEDWDTLVVEVAAEPSIVARFEEDARKLRVVVPSLAVAAAVLGGDLGRRPPHLRFREHLVCPGDEGAAGADAVWAALAGLHDGGLVVSLHLLLQAEGPVARSRFRWPRGRTLRSLHTVVLQIVDAVDGAEPTCGAFESFLSSHSRVRFVDLLTPSLVPLLDLCGPGLSRVAVPATPCLARRLERFRELQELRLEGVQTYALTELVRLVGSSSTLSRLQSLSIRSAAPCVEVVRALGAGRVPGLTHLKLAVPVHCMAALPAALSGLPRLRSLVLRGAPTSAVLADISVPALDLLTVLSDPCAPLPVDEAGDRRRAGRGHGDVCRHAALCALVRRCAGLHVLCRPCPPYLAALRKANPAIRDDATLLLAEHPDSGYTEPCRRCNEARDLHRSTHYLATTRGRAHADARLQFVCVRKRPT